MDGLRLALPKGRLLPGSREMLQAAGLGLDGYVEGSRQYRLKSVRFPEASGKVFQEKDIPIQVAVGNYDIGICGRQWVDEFLARYPLGALVLVRELEYGRGAIYAIARQPTRYQDMQDLIGAVQPVRLVSEYPNLAEAFALKARLRRFQVFPVWGAAESYPPENSDIAVLWRESADGFDVQGMIALKEIMSGGACIVANGESWAQREMGTLLQALCSARSPRDPAPADGPPQADARPAEPATGRDAVNPPEAGVWLALPDGHQQTHVVGLLKRAGIAIAGYEVGATRRQPDIGIEGIRVKVVRPQDMPQQVANGNFDLAITGRDWLTDHLCRFPSSPVREVLDLGFGRVRLVAAISGETPVGEPSQLRGWAASSGKRFLRVASEYVNIADRFAREKHLAPYKVIPTWGATEAFIPEDADVLIENTETGRTLAEHNLRVIDTLAVSTACLIANVGSAASALRRDRMGTLVEALKRGLDTV